MLEPADAQEAKEYIKLAFEISATFDTPVFSVRPPVFLIPNQWSISANPIYARTERVSF